MEVKAKIKAYCYKHPNGEVSITAKYSDSTLPEHFKVLDTKEFDVSFNVEDSYRFDKCKTLKS